VREGTKVVAYRTLDWLTPGAGIKRIINGDAIRFPARWSRYYPSNYERAKHRFLRRECHGGATVFDLGAHIGLYSVLMASRVGKTGRVFAFEPTPSTRQILEQTVALNGLQGVVEVHGNALARRSGHVVLYDTGVPASNANSLIKSERAQTEISVSAVSLDEFVADRVLSHIACLKIDIEGGELEMLEGASRTLREERPAVALEVHPDALRRSGRSPRDLWLLLAEHEFAAFSDDDMVDESWFSGHPGSFEVQLVPAERLAGHGRRSR
jgi:FkbM family methyltransferase